MSTYDDDLEFEAVQLMERIGGSFASALAIAWQRADIHNQWRLRMAFPHLLQEYKEKAASIRNATR